MIRRPFPPLSPVGPLHLAAGASGGAPLPRGAHIPPLQGTLSHGQMFRLRFTRQRVATISLAVLAFLYAVALLAEFIAPYDRLERHIGYAYAPPQLPRFNFRHGLHVYALRQHVDPVTFEKSYHEDPSVVVPLAFFTPGTPVRAWGIVPIERRLLGPDRSAFATVAATAPFAPGDPTPEPTFYLLGADKYGRDIFSRIVHGSRVSLSIGAVSIVITFLLGLSLGGLSGYCGGRVDTVIQRLIEVVNALPQLPLWLALAAVMPPDWSPLITYFAITLVLSLLNWTSLARVVRGRFLALREEEYAVAARLLGASDARVIFRHLLPGVSSHAIVVLTMSVPAMILGETALSFLGLGLRAPVVSWGVLLQDCLSLQAVATYPWLLAPVLPIIVTVLGFNFLGDGLRDAADPLDS
jgi:peptide/nickel transport system permease protein